MSRLLALLVSISLTLITPAFAWGALGHTTVALLAEERLDPTVKDIVRSILLGIPLVTAGNMADEYRVTHPETDRWHYVDIPDDQTSYDAARDCAVLLGGDCVIAAIAREQAIILNPKSGVFDRADALKRLVHWVGDIHQPFHTIERTVDGVPDRGGNELDVRFYDWPKEHKNSNMHAVWDSGLFARDTKSFEDFAADIRALEPGLPATETGVTDPVKWAEASHAVAHAAYVPDVPKKTEILDQAYVDANLPIAKHQLALAAVHLANLLNSLFAGKTVADFQP